jgi:hypothetical protein
LRVSFTTTIEEDLINKLKIEAVKRKVNVNDILEELIKGYFKIKK